MIALVGSIGWGLLALGAVTHVWHHRRLRSLLAMHLNHERVPAVALTAVEVVLAIVVPIGFLNASAWLPWVAATATVVAAGFVGWITRLLLASSSLPCACSFSDAPTTVWSLGRACCVMLVAAFALTSSDAGVLVDVATLATGLGCAAGIFVLPEAVAWPAPSKAIMARVGAHDGPV